MKDLITTILREHNTTQDSELINTVQYIVDRVYPHIVTNLGPSAYFDEIPPVELWKDIYARLSGIEEMRGEESESSKAQFEENENKIYVYYPNMVSEEDVIRSLLHEYTHHLQDPEKWEEYRKEGYDNNPYEIASRKAEENWKDYLIYLQDNLNESIPQPGSSSAQGIKDETLPYETKYLTLDEILTTVKSIPYYKEVLMDLRDDKEDWAVTQTVKRYAQYWMEHPESLTSESFPPIQVIGDGLKDGAHRISTLNALANHIDPDNPYWTDVKLEVRFYPIEVVKDIGPTWVNNELVYDTKDGLKSKPLNEQIDDMEKEVSGLPLPLIKFLRYLFTIYTPKSGGDFVKIIGDTLGLSNPYAAWFLYIVLIHNLRKTIYTVSPLEMLNKLEPHQYEIPSIYTYQAEYYGSYESYQEEDECDNQGYGSISGEECDCETYEDIEVTIKYDDGESENEIMPCDEATYEQREEELGSGEVEECECYEWEYKEIEMHYYNMTTANIFSTQDINTKDMEELYDMSEVYELLEPVYEIIDEHDEAMEDERETWDYFDDSREGELMEIYEDDTWSPEEIVNEISSITSAISPNKPTPSPDVVSEESDVFGQGLLDPIEPEEFEGEDEEWEKMMADVENDPAAEPEYEYTGGRTDPAKGFVAPSAEVTNNICSVEGFCKAQGPITFGQLKALVEEATKKRIQADMGRGVFKTLWRIIPFFIPQILLAAVGITLTRAINKIITPALTDTRGYKEWWGKLVLKAMDVAEGDYVPDIALGDDPFSKIFFISDGLMQMIRDKYKLKFARYVAEVAASKPDNEPVPDWFVENLLRDYLNQKFLLDPPLPIKQGVERQSLNEEDTLDTKEESPDLEIGDRIMVWDLTADPSPPGGYFDYPDDAIPIPRTLIGTVIDSLDDDELDLDSFRGGIKYMVRDESTGEEYGLYRGHDTAQAFITPMTYEGRDKWIKLPPKVVKPYEEIINESGITFTIRG